MAKEYVVPPSSALALEGFPASQLEVGDFAEVQVTFTQGMVDMFAYAGGDQNLIHVSLGYAQGTRFNGTIVHGVLLASQISRLLGTALPGLGTVFVDLHTWFPAPVYVGATARVRVTVKEIREKGRVLLSTEVFVGGEKCLDGEALVIAPREYAYVRVIDIPIARRA